MFELYDEKARESLFFARYEAAQVGSPFIEPEHLLLGLLRLDENAASRFLSRLPDIRTLLAERSQAREKIPTSVEIPFSKPCKRALDVAAQESDRLQHAHIGPEHLLLALLADPMTVAGDLLARNGLQLDAVRQQIAARSTIERPGRAAADADASPERRRQVALQEIDAAATVIQGLGEDYAQTDEARRLIDQICRDIEALKSHLPEA